MLETILGLFTGSGGLISIIVIGFGAAMAFFGAKNTIEKNKLKKTNDQLATKLETERADKQAAETAKNEKVIAATAARNDVPITPDLGGVPDKYKRASTRKTKS